VNAQIELGAMGAIAAALDGIDDAETRSRVLRWAAEHYGVALPGVKRIDGAVTPPVDVQDPPRQVGRASSSEPTFGDFVDLFDAVDPKTDIDKALTAAYWLQVVSKQPSWQSLRLNNLLKDTGHGLPNVTSTLSSAQAKKPALVRQMSKNGKAAQAWKTYKLTTTGVAHIRGKLGLSGAVPAALVDNGED
jgi:hypothetical protein